MNINDRIFVKCICIMHVTSQSYMACMALVKEVTAGCCSGLSMCKHHCANSRYILDFSLILSPIS